MLEMLTEAIERITGSCNSLFDMIADLLRDRYFSRVWTTQEVVLSRECIVCYGKSAIPWPDFAKAAMTVSSKSNKSFLKGSAEGFLTFWLLWCHNNEPPADTIAGSKLFSLALILTLDRVATDPRDKIFALYWIFFAHSINLPPPDYSKSVEKVYTEIAAAIIKRKRSLLILSLVNNNQRLPSLPSWVPDWSAPSPASPLLPPEGARFFATREPQFSEGDRLLHVFGKVFGRISSRSESFREYPAFMNLNITNVAALVAAEGLRRVRVLQDWTRVALRLPSYPTGEDLTATYFATVTQDFSKLSDDDFREKSRAFPNRTAYSLESTYVGR